MAAVGAVLDWFSAPDLAALALSAGVAVLILLGSRLAPAVPVALLAVVAATVVTRVGPPAGGDHRRAALAAVHASPCRR